MYLYDTSCSKRFEVAYSTILNERKTKQEQRKMEREIENLDHDKEENRYTDHEG